MVIHDPLHDSVIMASFIPTDRDRSTFSKPVILSRGLQTTDKPNVVFSELRIRIAILVVCLVVASTGLSFALGYFWIRYQRTFTQHRRHGSHQSVAFGILDSSFAVDLAVPPGHLARSDGRDTESRCSYDTILSPKSSTQAVFETNRMSTMTPTPTRERRDNILDRRGRTRLKCDTTAHLVTGMVNNAQILQSCPVYSLRVLPVFGFDEGTITPPIGSPLWHRRPESAHISDSPQPQHSGRSLVPFSDVMF